MFFAGNFTDEDVGEPILDVILEAGDLLYFPRGTIHQGCTLEDTHSLHITVSCCQKNTWADLFEKVKGLQEKPSALKFCTLLGGNSRRLCPERTKFYIESSDCVRGFMQQKNEIFLEISLAPFQLIPTALEIASQEDVEFRQSLPKDYLNYMGIAFSDLVRSSCSVIFWRVQ